MVRASATMLMMVLLSVHTLFFFAGQEGVRPSQTDSPHEAFINNASGDNLQDAVSQENRSGILPNEFRVGFRSLEGLDVVVGVLTSPYTGLFDNFPEPFDTLGRVMLFFLEAWTMLLVFRGVSG